MDTEAERLCGKVCMDGGSIPLVGGTCSDAATELLNRGVFMDAVISVKAEIRIRVWVFSEATHTVSLNLKQTCYVPQALA